MKFAYDTPQEREARALKIEAALATARTHFVASKTSPLPKRRIELAHRSLEEARNLLAEHLKPLDLTVEMQISSDTQALKPKSLLQRLMARVTKLFMASPCAGEAQNV